MKQKIIELWDLILVFLFHLFISPLLASYLLALLIPNSQYIGYYITFMSYIITFIFFAGVKRNLFSISVGKVYKSPKLALYVFYGIVSSFLLNVLLSTIISPNQPAQNTQMVVSSGVVIGLLVASILAPIFEELFYRAMFKSIISSYGLVSYILLTSIIFALPHIQLTGDLKTTIYSVLGPLASGIIFSYLYRKTNWIGTSILVHSGYNAIVLVLAFLLH